MALRVLPSRNPHPWILDTGLNTEFGKGGGGLMTGRVEEGVCKVQKKNFQNNGPGIYFQEDV